MMSNKPERTHWPSNPPSHDSAIDIASRVASELRRAGDRKRIKEKEDTSFPEVRYVSSVIIYFRNKISMCLGCEKFADFQVLE